MLIGLRNVFKIQNLDQIDDLYMETGMYLSADVLEHFLYLCLGMYCIDAAHFYTVLGLPWQAALEMAVVKLELLTDPEMHLFV